MDVGTDRANLKLLKYCNSGKSVFHFPDLFNSMNLLTKSVWNAKKISQILVLKINESCSSPAYLDILALWYQLLQLRDTQPPKIWGHPKVHQAPLCATSSETQQYSGTLTKFAYDKPSISQQIRTSSSHPIPPPVSSWDRSFPELLALLSCSCFTSFCCSSLGGRGWDMGAQTVWAFRCTWGYQHGTVYLLLVTLTSSGFLGLVILPFLLSFLPSMGFLLRNHLYFTPQIKRQKEIRDWGILFRHFFQTRWIFTKPLRKDIPECMRLFGECYRKEDGLTI